MNNSHTPWPDGSWADPLSRKERRELSTRLSRACKRLHDAGTRDRRGKPLPPLKLVHAALCASAEMGDLHLDVTERAQVAAS